MCCGYLKQTRNLQIRFPAVHHTLGAHQASYASESVTQVPVTAGVNGYDPLIRA